MKKLSLTTLVLVLAAAGTAAAQVATVNGVAIPQSRFEAALKTLTAQGRPDSPELRKALRDELIGQEVLVQEATKKGLQKNAAVAAQIDLRRQEVLANAFMEEHFRTNPIGDETLKKEYERIKGQLGAREYKARHILVEKEDEAKDIMAKIKGGASFEKLAAERSKDPGAKQNGGDLGWAVPSNYVKPFADALTRLKKGQMTEAPVQTNFGWHVIRLDDERSFKAPTFDEVKNNLHRSLIQQQIQKVVGDLRAKAKVE